jgi:four helix bundle protein
MRPAAVSLTNNIAEGHGRYHDLDEIKFEVQSRGSLAELLDDLNVCQDEDYLSVAEIVELKEQAKEVQCLINGYIRFLRSRNRAFCLSFGSPMMTISSMNSTILFNDLTF